MNTIRIPKTATRRGADAGCKTWAKLLSHVDEGATNGYGFAGEFVDRGALINDDEIADGAVILEAAGNDGSAKYVEPVFVLWQRRGSEFVELARASGKEWAFALRDVARDALSNHEKTEQPATSPEPAIDLSAVPTEALLLELAKRGVTV